MYTLSWYIFLSSCHLCTPLVQTVIHSATILLLIWLNTCTCCLPSAVAHLLRWSLQYLKLCPFSSKHLLKDAAVMGKGHVMGKAHANSLSEVWTQC